MGTPDPVVDAQFYDGVPLRRFSAFLVDVVVIFIIMVGISAVGTLIGLVTFGLGFAFVLPAFALAGFVYRFLMIRQHSATLGMLLSGIELRDANGNRLDDVTAALHTAGFYVALYIPVLMLAGIVHLAVDPRRRLLHDLPLGTVAINRPA